MGETRRWWTEDYGCRDGGVGGGGEHPLVEAELRQGEEGDDGLVAGAGIVEAVQPQHKVLVACRHDSGFQLVGEGRRLRVGVSAGRGGEEAAHSVGGRREVGKDRKSVV